MGRPKFGQIARVDLICRQCGIPFSKPLSQADRPFHKVACYRAYQDDPQRFHEKVLRPEGELVCWPHTAKVGADGYVAISIGAQLTKAHRHAWVLASGAPIPHGLLIGHICDNRICTRNDGPLGTYELNGRLLPRYGHLFLGTDDDNNEDKEMKQRGNHPKGEAHGIAKLRTEDVLEIRRLYATTSIAQWELGEQFDVSQGIVSKIIRRVLWAHVR
jgi:HNH endonuclease